MNASPDRLDLAGRWRRYWFECEVHPLRLNLLRVLVFSLLAFDVWMLNIEHAPRYGAGGFNVTQLRWLDALMPTPHVIVVGALWLVAGFLALQAALGLAVRLSIIGACAAYNLIYYWSQADSYQHHYLLGLLLLLCVFMPFDHPQTQRRRPEASAPIYSWAWRLLKWQMAITYFYTGVTKWAPNWWDGSVMQQLTPACSPLLDHIATQGEILKLSVPESWRLAAVGVMVVELLAPLPFLLPKGGRALLGVLPIFYVFIGWGVLGSTDWGALIAMAALIAAAGYATLAYDKGWLALGALPIAAWLLSGDGDVQRWLAVFTAAQCAAIFLLGRLRMVWLFGLLSLPVFHILVEFLNLEIGWFSIYMLALDFILLTPPSLWRWLQRGLAGLGDRLDGVKGWIDGLAAPTTSLQWMYGLTGAIAVGALTLALPFEGMPWVAALMAAAVLLSVVGGSNLLERRPAPKLLAQLLIAGAMVGALNASAVPFDYYRFWAGDLKRRGAASARAVDDAEHRRATLELAAEKYAKANAVQAPDTPARHYALAGVLDQLGRTDEAAEIYAEEVSIQKRALAQESTATRKSPSAEGWLELAEHYNGASGRMRRIATRLNGLPDYSEIAAEAQQLAGAWKVEARKAYESLLAVDSDAPRCLPGASRLARSLSR